MASVLVVECDMPKGVYVKSADHGRSLSLALQGNKNAQLHGSCPRGKRSSEYVAWQNMRARCNNPDHPTWDYYGGRGIKVSPVFDDFAAFLADVGPKPSPLLTLDRINNDGDYEPGNLRWATRREQNLNQRPRKRREA